MPEIVIWNTLQRMIWTLTLAGSAIVIRVYELCAGPEESSLHVYATIAEAHHPQHVVVNDDMLTLSDIPKATWGADARGALEKLLATVA